MKIAQIVWNILKSDLALQKDLDKGLINVRGLAKYILNKYSLEASLDAVISAIRRFEAEKVYEKEDKVILSLFKDAKIATRNNIACLTIKKAGLKSMKAVLDKDIRAIIGTEEIKIICEKKYLEDIKEIFSDDVEKVEEDLSELDIVISEKAVKQKGVLARISNEIALHNINILESIICPPEFLIYVKEKDAVKTYELLLGLTK